MRQQTLFKREKVEFGGSLLLKKRKSKRPLTTKAPIHIVLKVDSVESGYLFKHTNFIKEQLTKWSFKFNVNIFEQSIGGDHIHLGLQITSSDDYKKFIRTFTGQTAKTLNIKWILRPYTRLVRWGKDFQNLKDYIIQNHEEALGLRPYKPRK